LFSEIRKKKERERKKIKTKYSNLFQYLVIEYYSATLFGTNEIPPVVGPYVGTIRIVFSPATKQITAAVSTTISNATDANIHFGFTGTNGPIAINVGQTNGMVNGLPFATTIEDDVIFALRAGYLYFNIYTSEFPNGAIRGQIASSSISLFIKK